MDDVQAYYDTVTKVIPVSWLKLSIACTCGMG